jgi:hypothetical protein
MLADALLVAAAVAIALPARHLQAHEVALDEVVPPADAAV